MLNFHFCREFLEKIIGRDYEDFICNKILDNKKRDDLKNIGNLSNFTGSIYVLKTKNPTTRTIIEEKIIKIDSKSVKVFFVREIIANGNFDYIYGKVTFPQLKSGDWIKNYPLPDDDKQKFIKKYKSERTVKKEERTPPPIHLTLWLDEFRLKLDNEVFETEEWVKYALNDSLSDGMSDKYVNVFRMVIEDILNNNVGYQILKEQNGLQVRKCIKHNIGIVYSIINLDTKSSVVVLFNGAHIKIQTDHWNKIIEDISQKDIEFKSNIDNICRKAFRSYPKWTVSNDEMWFDIQKSKEMSNLSLTREQIEFFKNFKFPHYINGQAGSGKSTMLYYLFSNAYYYKCAGEIQGEILFLTENEKLLDITKNSVFDLLSNNPEFNDLSIDQRTNSKKHFNSFRKFLLNRLPQSDRINFKEDMYLNFSTFKYLYENSKLSKHIIKKYSAEESWFTIITYIYGYDIDKKITSKNYDVDVKSKSRIITNDIFRGIEENVLPFYEKLINEDGYWDKLKIIRYIEKNIINQDKYSVLICDEAQDFCRVELRFILRLSEYLKYDLSKIDQVPIIFAGDPNQTVNPTGYRQDEMTSMLYNELKEIAKFDYKSNKNIYNPTYNYRSAQPVVSLANFIQYHRMKNLGITQVRPQVAKRPDPDIDKDFNVFLNYETIENNPELKNDLVEKLKYKIFIVPVDSQEKQDYIKNDKLLSSINEAEVKTSVESKGAEYKQVVLFGFGEYFIEQLKKLSNKNISPDEYFKRRYFFNKLYVGLTRAQTELIIIDSVDSENIFWRELVNNIEITSSIWKPLEDYMSKTIEYNAESVKHITISTQEDAYANAKKDKEQGIYNNNPARLRVAANQFFKLDNKYKEEGYTCLALSEQLKGNWKSASEYFMKPSLNNTKLEEAADCLFRGRHFKEIISKFENKLNSSKQDIRVIISRLVNGDRLMKQDINILHKEKDTLYEMVKDLEWRDELIILLIDNSKWVQVIEQKKSFVEVLESVATSVDYELWKEIGNLNFELKKYQNAIDAWTVIDSYENNMNYYISQIELSRSRNDNENLVLWLDESLKLQKEENRLLIHKEIIDINQKNNTVIYSLDYYFSVYKSILLVQPKSSLKEFGTIVEKKFLVNLIDLRDFYSNLLFEYKFDKKTTVFIVERWAKTIWKLDRLNIKSLNLEELNTEYLKFSKTHSILFKEFGFEELQNIPEFPENINWTFSSHFHNLNIKNFRQFDNLSLTNIGQFNLIVGDNNVGKTSLLEVLLFSDNKNEYFKNLAFAYIDRKSIVRLVSNNKEYYDLQDNSFISDFIKKDSINQELQLTLIEERDTWNFQIRYATIDEIRNEIPSLVRVDIEEYISVVKNETDIDIVEIPLILKKIHPVDSIKSPLIPFGKGYGKDLAQIYYEKIEKNKRERLNFLKSMKIFIPNIDRIIVNTENGEIDIEESGEYNESSSLHQYGEGANKLFRILVQIMIQKDNRLLIDEIDAGIHFSHFSSFWKIILEVAKENNVQIFATTHNMECIKYFKKILQEEEFSSLQSHSRIITLRKLPDKSIKAYTRIFDEFEYELNNRLEIRGGDL